MSVRDVTAAATRSVRPPRVGLHAEAIQDKLDRLDDAFLFEPFPSFRWVGS